MQCYSYIIIVTALFIIKIFEDNNNKRIKEVM